MKKKIEKFEDILAWQEARTLVKLIYVEFRSCRDFGFKDQIQRAVISIMNNIAEGYERKGNKEFAKFLYISKGSCAEVRSMVYVALDLNYIDENKSQELQDKADKISRMLSNLIRALA